MAAGENDKHFISLKKTRKLQAMGVETDEQYQPSAHSISSSGNKSG